MACLVAWLCTLQGCEGGRSMRGCLASCQRPRGREKNKIRCGGSFDFLCANINRPDRSRDDRMSDSERARLWDSHTSPSNRGREEKKEGKKKLSHPATPIFIHT
ncbi:hypothetical protein BZA05DRAFT_391666 [Tricharina praecox]|uniref:uncharacterized protein n=1 Tax=Tricharina praecox TaxID=43433 RepID=UPI00221F2735|nr:uncharacterized protein BZA05DRAFT_391666 [Tricharina praecox]KAI5855471.1 hypothetical protein BZA05DRAFT_391666 [Tricharina praecox]